MNFLQLIKHILLIVSFLSSLVVSWSAFARPEFALRHRINRCTACHLSPIGGNERNVYGKYYGARHFKPGPYSNQDLVSLDARMLYYRPDPGHAQSKGGLGWMAGIVSGNIPLVRETGKSEVNLVFGHNIGGFAAASVRNFYIRWKNAEDTETQFLPQYVMLGRFHTPFGILTDEHRALIRLQTRTGWNDFEMGAVMSSNPWESLHYDLAIVNGEKTAGTLASENALLWGQILNIRFMPATWPIMLGISGSYHRREHDRHSSPYAGSVYAMLSFDRLTSGWFSGSLSAEYSRAKFWNSSLETGFVDSTDYSNLVARSESEGITGQFNWDISRSWTLLYRYEQLALETSFPADAFRRHGVGFRHYLGPNMFLQGRVEDSQANHPSQKNGNGKGAVDGSFLLLQVGI